MFDMQSSSLREIRDKKQGRGRVHTNCRAGLSSSGKDARRLAFLSEISSSGAQNCVHINGFASCQVLYNGIDSGYSCLVGLVSRRVSMNPEYAALRYVPARP